MKRYVGINTPFGEKTVPSFGECDIDDNVSILDYDAVFIYADSLCAEFTQNHSQYMGLLALNGNQTNSLTTRFSTLRDQIEESLRNGNNTYVLVGDNANCYIDTGDRNTSGTSRSIAES